LALKLDHCQKQSRTLRNFSLGHEGLNTDVPARGLHRRREQPPVLLVVGATYQHVGSFPDAPLLELPLDPHFQRFDGIRRVFSPCGPGALLEDIPKLHDREPAVGDIFEQLLPPLGLAGCNASQALDGSDRHPGVRRQLGNALGLQELRGRDEAAERVVAEPDLPRQLGDVVAALAPAQRLVGRRCGLM
jgi:hypothetical protein